MSLRQEDPCPGKAGQHSGERAPTLLTHPATSLPTGRAVGATCWSLGTALWRSL